jgi:hypothetical protein
LTLILLDGGPASGKNTLGKLLVQRLEKPDNQVVLLDLDDYVEKINPSWVWEDRQKEKVDIQQARENFAQAIDGYLQTGFNVIAIGERFLTKEDIAGFLNRLKGSYVNFHLYHLDPPFKIRKERLHQRGPSTLIDLEKDQREREANAKWYGYVYENIHSPIEDAEILMGLIDKNAGLLETTLFCKTDRSM